MLKIIAQIIGFALMFIGVLGVLTPIPFGIFFFILSLLFLVPTTPFVTRLIRRMRGRFPWRDARLLAITRRLPMPYRRVLRETENSGF